MQNAESNGGQKQGGRMGRRAGTDEKAKVLAGEKGRRRMAGDLEAMHCSDV